MSKKNLFRSSSFAKVADAHPIRFFDIGARGGFDADLWPLAFATDAVGFEPDPEAFAALAKRLDSDWKSARMLPVAVGGSNAARTLYIPSDPQAASLLGPTERKGAARFRTQFFEPVKTLQVETVTLDEVLLRFDVAQPDYLKIDIEGAELEVLKNAPKTLDGLLALKIEVAFDTFRDGQPLASDVMSFLHEAGFVLMDFIRPSYWRSHSQIVHPLMDRSPFYYSRGQLAHGDLVYLRRQENLTAAQPSAAKRKIKLGLIAMGLGFFDFAADIFNDTEVKRLAGQVSSADLSQELLSCAKTFGRYEAKKALTNKLRSFGPHMRRILDIILR